MSHQSIHNKFLRVAQDAACKATCLRANCGVAIVDSHLTVIATGFNQPALGLESNRKCRYQFPVTNVKKPKTDRTCCVHAEDNAIIAALKAGYDLAGCTLYFMRVDDEYNQTIAGEPYCIACAKMALNNGIAFWVLLQESGPVVYDATSYYELSIEYHHPKKA